MLRRNACNSCDRLWKCTVAWRTQRAARRSIGRSEHHRFVRGTFLCSHCRLHKSLSHIPLQRSTLLVVYPRRNRSLSVSTGFLLHGCNEGNPQRRQRIARSDQDRQRRWARSLAPPTFGLSDVSKRRRARAGAARAVLRSTQRYFTRSSCAVVFVTLPLGLPTQLPTGT